ncbi:MAG: DUF1801 domain-containing protein [Flavobacteriales bacterium]
MTDIEEFYAAMKEPNKSCFLFLKHFILKQDSLMEEKWKWKLPFFYYNKKPFCYLWVNKETNLPYVCFVRSLHINRPEMLLEGRKKMKSLTIDPREDIDIDLLSSIIKESLIKFNP